MNKLDRVHQNSEWLRLLIVAVNQLHNIGLDSDFCARQIVDDCWRAGYDIRFQQHIIEFFANRILNNTICMKETME